MMEILEFIFASFWRWLGTLLILVAICPWNCVSTRSEKDDENP